jgi:GR25 family glycosyltransferase involved in LPS biosynthesis
MFETYIISLQKDKERRNWMESIKDKIGLDFKFFDAIETNYISEQIIERYFSKTDFNLWDVNEKAVMATFMSHIELLKYSMNTKTNLLILEDDIDIVKRYNWKDVNFEEFDLYNVGKLASCHSYFVSYQGASKILEHFDNIIITQAYDWELYKIKHINTKLIREPLFIQTNEFVSNTAPNGYKLK